MQKTIKGELKYQIGIGYHIWADGIQYRLDPNLLAATFGEDVYKMPINFIVELTLKAVE